MAGKYAAIRLRASVAVVRRRVAPVRSQLVREEDVCREERLVSEGAAPCLALPVAFFLIGGGSVVMSSREERRLP